MRASIRIMFATGLITSMMAGMREKFSDAMRYGGSPALPGWFFSRSLPVVAARRRQRFPTFEDGAGYRSEGNIESAPAYGFGSVGSWRQCQRGRAANLRRQFDAGGGDYGGAAGESNRGPEPGFPVAGQAAQFPHDWRPGPEVGDRHGDTQAGGAGVPEPQIASALGDLFRDENSVDVKTDILNELGNLEDPSAYDQIVAGLDQHQSDEVHTAAIEELDDLGDKRAIPLLQPFLLGPRCRCPRRCPIPAIDSLNDQ